MFVYNLNLLVSKNVLNYLDFLVVTVVLDILTVLCYSTVTVYCSSIIIYYSSSSSSSSCDYGLHDYLCKQNCRHHSLSSATPLHYQFGSNILTPFLIRLSHCKRGLSNGHFPMEFSLITLSYIIIYHLNLIDQYKMTKILMI